MITNSAHRANTRRTRWAPTSLTSDVKILNCGKQFSWRHALLYSHNFWPHCQDHACVGLVDRSHLLSASDLRLQAQDPPLDGGVQVDYAAPFPLHLYWWQCWCYWWYGWICQKLLIGILQTVHYHRLLRREVFQSGQNGKLSFFKHILAIPKPQKDNLTGITLLCLCFHTNMVSANTS